MKKVEVIKGEGLLGGEIRQGSDGIGSGHVGERLI